MKNQFFEKMNKVNKSLVKKINKGDQEAQISNTGYEKGDITTDTSEIQKTVRNSLKKRIPARQ